MSRGKLQQNMQSKSGNLGGCQSKDNFGDVEIIDLDSGDADVEIIDAPRSSHQGSKFVRKEATSSPNCVISIDDDDDDDESGTDSHAETSGSQYGRPRNRYGLDFTSETESFATGTSGSKDSSGVGFSEGEGSDCEILDDSSGSIRQEWERAHSRKTTPPDRVETTPCENVERHSNKSFEDSFNDCFGDCSGLRKKFGLHGDGGACSAPNADSSENPSKEKVSSKGKLYGSFVPGMFQEEIRERVFPYFSFKSCSYRKGKSVFSDNGVRDPEKMVVEEEIAKEADNGGRSAEKMEVEDNISKEADNCGRSAEKMEVEDNISKEADNCGRSLEKMNVEEENVKKASFGIANRMNDDEEKEKCKPTRDVESSLMENSCMASEANKHCEKIGEGSALLCVHEANTEAEHDECLLGEREKHKKSDEYQRADEIEQASRQEQLRIQAEEAQRLKKRKRAETMRLLDMEKRQKQRLEEMRQNQKKNEETLSLKEGLRAEVRKDLERMEKRYTDMASILRSLGIPVGGGLFPIPNQVKSAYKQALLKFHPDRVQSSDVHQQVKAEETFKFISRLKEKLLPAA